MTFPGIVLEKSIAERIWNENLREIISNEPIKSEGSIYYMDNEKCYGIFKVKSLRNKGKKYQYEIEILDQFETPKPVEVPENTFFLETTKFLYEEEKHLTLMIPYAIQKPKNQIYNLNKFIEELEND